MTNTKHTPTHDNMYETMGVNLNRITYDDSPRDPKVRLYKCRPETWTLQIRGIDHRKEKWIANAELDEKSLIVRAVNSHEALVNACKMAYHELMSETTESVDTLDALEQALEQAEGK